MTLTSSATVFTWDATGYQIRCSHVITVPTTAFSRGASAVTVLAANDRYSSCRDTWGSNCTVQGALGSLLTHTVTTGALRFGLMPIQCTAIYTCVLAPNTGGTLEATFANPVPPSTRGVFTLTTPNSISYTHDPSSRACTSLGPVGSVSTVTRRETLSTDNLRFR